MKVRELIRQLQQCDLDSAVETRCGLGGFVYEAETVNVIPAPALAATYLKLSNLQEPRQKVGTIRAADGQIQMVLWGGSSSGF
jgi:hypothetical protein